MVLLPCVSQPQQLNSQRCLQVEGFDPATISVFSTRNQAAKTDTYFLDSANSIGFFFEEKAFGPDGQLVQPKNRAINKIGHGARAGDEETRRCLCRASGGAALTALLQHGWQQ